ncbi:RAMP superfamily CRISPR-associated protein [Rubinisphaera italica]|uniref:RAMP superfamily protein n=1 Tax=Rubinisphaera italica TaxID=2527969 RepID=A0A5C5XMD5_9PLAN|nr:RAMP superfamily CRISPR-associated protein [Rubinisphaera italica]TWT63729.1 RAMP superfamily protein [Rubinisphaera italica]
MIDQSKIEIPLELKFESDWHIGSGLEQPGGDDRLVRRDADKLPFVPAKSLRGMLRDAAEMLAWGLDQELSKSNDPQIVGRWQDWVQYLFGDQPTRDEIRDSRQLASGHVSVSPAHLPSDLREALKPVSKHEVARNSNRQDFRQALVFTKPGVKIGPNGRAIDRHLRFDEMVRQGTLLESQLLFDTSELDGTQKAFATNFLKLAMFYVERIGGKRRRGAGRVVVQEKSVSDKKMLVTWFEGVKVPPAIPEQHNRYNTEPIPFAAEKNEDNWVRYQLDIDLLDPLLVADRVAGNVVKSLDFIPGTLLLPIVTRQLRKIDSQIQQKIIAGDVRVSNATVVVQCDDHLSRGLPTPGCLFHPKGDENWFKKGELINQFSAGDQKDSRKYIKAYRDGFVAVAESRRPQHKAVDKIVNPHNTVGEKEQRPTTEVGGIFSYEAIPAGTRLRSEILIRESIARQLDTTDSHWQKKLSQQEAIGRSKSADYGRVKLTCQSLSASSTSHHSTNELILWLTSDLIIKDSTLRSVPTATEVVAAVESVVGVKATRDGNGNSDVLAFIRHRRVESWHVRWGLPRPSLVCIAGGSCLRIQFEQEIDAETIARLEREGLGLRRAEGFGTVLINHPLTTKPVTSWPEESEDSTKKVDDSPEKLIEKRSPHFDYARQIEKTLWQRKIQHRCMELISKPDQRKAMFQFTNEKPNPAQAALLRNQVCQKLKSDQRTKILDKLLEKRNEKWPNSTLDTIRDLISDKHKVWNDSYMKCKDWPTLTVTGQSELQELLWEEAVRTLLGQLLKSHQRDREKRRETN